MEYPIKTIQHNGFTININYDIGAESPREWCNLGLIVGNHRHYNLVDDCNPYGGEYGSYESDFKVYLKKSHKESIDNVVALPVYLYDHSGITLNTTGFSCRWDSGQLGYIFVSKKDIRKEYNVKRVSNKLISRVEEYLVNEIKVLSQYAEGEVYSFEVFDENGNFFDCCGGFYDLDDAVIEAKNISYRNVA